MYVSPLKHALTPQIIGICHEMLYPNPSVTADLIKTGRYQSILTRLKPELDYLWQWLVGDMRSADGPSEEFRQSGIDPELQELMWRVDFDYVRWVSARRVRWMEFKAELGVAQEGHEDVHLWFRYEAGTIPQGGPLLPLVLSL